MEETPLVVHLEETDAAAGTGRLVIEGDVEALLGIATLIALTFAAGSDEDCGDPNCPVHGQGFSEVEDGDEDLSGTA